MNFEVSQGATSGSEPPSTHLIVGGLGPALQRSLDHQVFRNGCLSDTPCSLRAAICSSYDLIEAALRRGTAAPRFLAGLAGLKRFGG